MKLPLLQFAGFASIALLINQAAPSAAQTAPYRAASDYSSQQKGEALLIYEDDRLVFEEYSNQFKKGQPHKLASGTKSFSCAIATAAQQDGLLSLNERVSDTITEWKSDPAKAGITVRQLLSLSSGLNPGKEEVMIASNKNLEAISQPLQAAPGTKFIYGPASYGVFSELMTRKLKGDPVAYLERRVLNPIGLKVANWNRDSSGNASLFGGLWLEASEWAKYGLLIARKGVWKGRVILPAALLEQCFVPSPANPAYGLTFWLSPNVPGVVEAGRRAAVDSQGRTVAFSAPADFSMAAGAGKQRLYLIPSQKLVVVRFGNGGPFSDAEFLKLLLP